MPEDQSVSTPFKVSSQSGLRLTGKPSWADLGDAMQRVLKPDNGLRSYTGEGALEVLDGCMPRIMFVEGLFWFLHMVFYECPSVNEHEACHSATFTEKAWSCFLHRVTKHFG